MCMRPCVPYDLRTWDSLPSTGKQLTAIHMRGTLRSQLFLFLLASKIASCRRLIAPVVWVAAQNAGTLNRLRFASPSLSGNIVYIYIYIVYMSIYVCVGKKPNIFLKPYVSVTAGSSVGSHITQKSIGVMDQNYIHHKINGNQNLWVLWDPMFDPQPHDPEMHRYLSSSFPIKIRIKATTLWFHFTSYYSNSPVLRLKSPGCFLNPNFLTHSHISVILDLLQGPPAQKKTT